MTVVNSKSSSWNDKEWMFFPKETLQSENIIEQQSHNLGQQF